MSRRIGSRGLGAATPHEDALALAIARGFVVRRGKYSLARYDFWLHCEKAHVPFIEAEVGRDCAYFLYDNHGTYCSSCGGVRLEPEEVETVSRLLRGALTPSGSFAANQCNIKGGPFVASKLLEVLPQIALIAQAATARFCATHPNAGEQPWCPHLSQQG